MPRRSTASLSVAAPAEPNRLLRPPSDLSAPARAVFDEIAASVPDDFFRASDFPLLRAYCEAGGLASAAAAEIAANGAVVDGRTSPWVKILETAHRSMGSLALRLRLCPSSRIGPRTVGRHKAGHELVDFGRLNEEA
jgi:phage terminase small subunit